MDIWRYFRYTWLTPYNTVPGRNINFLIRNAAKPKHPVMGIATLASPMMNLSVRDNYIGWTIDAVENKLQRKKRVHEYEEQRQKRSGRRTRKLESPIIQNGLRPRKNTKRGSASSAPIYEKP